MFYILDAGARIHTPLNRLLENRDVPTVAATARVRPVSDQESSRNPEREPALRQQVEAVYSEAEPPEAPRHQIKFAHEIMTTPVVTGRVDQPLNAIWALFASHRIHHLPLLDSEGRVSGIVSDRDITRFAANAGRVTPNKPIRELMTQRVVTAGAEAEVRDLAEVLIRLRIGAIPITDDDGAAQGIVTRTDILKTLVSRAPLELWS